MACEVGVLVDLSETAETCENIPSPSVEHSSSSATDNILANTSDISVADSIELLRSDDCLKTNSQPTPCIEKRVLHDVTNTTPHALKMNTKSPAVKLLDEEIFDFDIALSPMVRDFRNSSIDKSEDSLGDEEVFFGPMGFTEQLVSVAVCNKDPLADEIKPLSPLNPEQIAELVKEAHGVACRISNDRTKPQSQSSDEGKSKKVLTFSKSSTSSSDDQNSSMEVTTERPHVRTKTFVLTSDPIISLQEMRRKSLPSADLVSQEMCCVDININSEDSIPPKKPPSGEEKLKNNECCESDKLASGKSTATKRKELPKPSKLGMSRLSMKRSGSNLYKAVSCDNINSVELDEARPRQKSDNSDVSDSVSVTSDLSVTSDITDVSSSKLISARRSLQQPRIKAPLTKISKLQAPKSTLTKAKLDSLKVVQPLEKTSKFLNRSMNAVTSQPNHKRTTSGASASSISSQTSQGSKSGVPTALPTNRSIKKPSVQVSNTGPSSLQVSSKPPTAKYSPGVKKSNTFGTESTSTSKLPAKKSQLMKPGELQRKNLATNRNTVSKVAQPGPVKAFGGSSNQPGSGLKYSANNKVKQELLDKPKENEKNVPNHVTPVKPQKVVHPKRLLSDSSCTPSKTSNVSASTPSSEKKRNSCLPTPNRLRLGSFDSHQSASSVRSSSCSSMASTLADNCSDSPVFTDREFMPIQSKRPLVQHTPNLPPKTQSIWSPIRKPRAISREDELIQCTKKIVNRN